MLKTKAKLHTIIRKEVANVFKELLSDPDAGQELVPSFEKRLKKSVRDKAGGRVTPLSKVLAKYSI